MIPSLRKLTNTCPHHHQKKFVCAADNVTALSQYVTLKPTEAPSADRSIRLFFEMGSLIALSTADLACLPKSFLLNYCERHIEEAWSRLPEKFKTDWEIAQCHRCYKHYNQGSDHIDGPAPLVKYCRSCHEPPLWSSFSMYFSYKFDFPCLFNNLTLIYYWCIFIGQYMYKTKFTCSHSPCIPILSLLMTLKLSNF